MAALPFLALPGLPALGLAFPFPIGEVISPKTSAGPGVRLRVE